MVAVSNQLKHGVTQEQARRAIDTALKVYCRKFPEYQPHTRWLNPHRAETTFHYKRMTLVAKVAVHNEHIDMGMDVPLLFYPFRNRALAFIENEIRKWLARAKAGE